jgi:hypothetical protein
MSDEVDLFEKHAERVVTYRFLGKMLRGTAAAVKQVLAQRDARLTEHDTRIIAFEQRIAALEAKPSVKYCGVWAANGDYSVGDAATHKGSLWICKSNHVQSEPGVDYVCW